MERRADSFLTSLEERLKFFSQLGIDYIEDDSSSLSVQERILLCQKCPLARERTHSVPGEGDLRAELMFVGEAPGQDEDIQGRPFVGKAGQLLTKIINSMHYKRDEVYITNIVKCRPPKNRTPHKDEIEKCRGYLFEQIEMIKPKVIVTLGRVAADFFIQSKLGMTALRGDFHDFRQIKVMPTFHPSYLIRREGDREIRRMVWEDMKEVMAFLGKK